MDFESTRDGPGTRTKGDGLDVDYFDGVRPLRRALTLQLQPLAVDCLSAVCRRDSPLARRERLTWADLSDLTIINLKRGTTLERQIDETLSAIGRHLEPNYEVSFLNTALAMVQQGLGVAILPGYLIRANPNADSLVALKLHDPIAERSLLVHTRQGHALSPAAERFLDMLRERLEPQP